MVVRICCVYCLLLLFQYLTFLRDVICERNTIISKNVTIGGGDKFLFQTSPDCGKYGPNIDCEVNYLMDSTCAEMKFSCSKLNIKGKKKDTNCLKKGGDWLEISTGDGETKV